MTSPSVQSALNTRTMGPLSSSRWCALLRTAHSHPAATKLHPTNYHTTQVPSCRLIVADGVCCSALVLQLEVLYDLVNSILPAVRFLKLQQIQQGMQHIPAQHAWQPVSLARHTALCRQELAWLCGRLGRIHLKAPFPRPTCLSSIEPVDRCCYSWCELH